MLSRPPPPAPRPASPASLRITALARRGGGVPTRAAAPAAPPTDAAPPTPRPVAPPLDAVPEDCPTPWPTDAATPFAWRAHWYPVRLVADLSTDAPNSVTLLGTPMVAWRDDAGAWRVAHAACPHRLASLADGRLIDGGASLECRYHGWRFGGDGACVHCPQATDGAACAAVRGSRRSRLRTYPAVVEEGVLWVWPQEGADAAAAAAATPLPLWRDDAPEAATVSFVSMRPPVDWMLMTENSVDPSHAPYLHEGVMGPNTRAGAAPMAMALAAPGVAPRGFTLTHTGYTKASRAAGMAATRTFIAPGALRTHYVYDDGREQIAVVYFTPTRPGECTTLAKFYGKKRAAAVGDAPPPAAAPRRPALPARVLGALLSSAVGHVFGHALSDQDVLVMRSVAAALQSAPPPAAPPASAARAYWLATPADVGVGAFHRWVTECGGGGPDWDPAVAPADRGLLTRAPGPDRASAFDHYARHTAHCATCLAALARLDRVRVWLLAAAFVGVAAAVGLAAARAGAGAAAGAVAAAGAAPAAVAVASGWAWVVTGRLRERFFRADKLADE